jgi:hypothetical protein
MTSNNDNYAPFFALHSLSFFSRSKLWRTLGVDFSRSRLYSVSRNSLDMRLSLRVTLVTRVITPPLPPGKRDNSRIAYHKADVLSGRPGGVGLSTDL